MTTADSTPARLQAIRERVDRVTAGEWEWQPHSRILDRWGELYAVNPDNTDDVNGVIENTVVGIQVSNADAVFIANAPADVRWLLGELERLQARVDKYAATIMELEAQLELGDET